jgi:hypothetical protein
MIDYCNRIQGFINYIISNPINISGGGSKCSCKRCKNKKFFDPDIVTMHFLQKRFIEQYLRRYAHGEPYVPHEITVERMVGSTSTISNVYVVVDENNNSYRDRVTDAMRMNSGHADQCPIID